MGDSAELVGYLASVLVVLSLSMTGIVRLRTISLIGSIVFCVYAILISSVPVFITNAAVSAVNVHHLRGHHQDHRQARATALPERSGI